VTGPILTGAYVRGVLVSLPGASYFYLVFSV